MNECCRRIHMPTKEVALYARVAGPVSQRVSCVEVVHGAYTRGDFAAPVECSSLSLEQREAVVGAALPLAQEKSCDVVVPLIFHWFVRLSPPGRHLKAQLCDRLQSATSGYWQTGHAVSGAARFDDSAKTRA